MKIHREGTPTLTLSAMMLTLVWLVFYLLSFPAWLLYLVALLGVGFWLFLLQFFRAPERHTSPRPGHILSPADGKVVIIAEVEEPEYFQDRRLQVSIFMSPVDVHANRSPVTGHITYAKYHPGKYLVAWHPKSSLLNERHTLVARDEQGREILYRQIAGAVARRIVCYVNEGDAISQGEEYGFIKFGSRLDLFLPLGTELSVGLGDKTKAGLTWIGRLPAAAR